MVEKISSPIQATKLSPQKGKFWITEIWEENRELFKAICGDVVFFFLILGVLWISEVFLDSLSLPDGLLRQLKTVHSLAYLTIACIMFLGLIAEVLIFRISRLKRNG